MSENGDMWREYREYKAKRKAKYQVVYQNTILPNILKTLEEKNINYKQLSDHHYRVFTEKSYFDYWISTGYWKSKCGKTVGYNLQPLLKQITK